MSDRDASLKGCRDVTCCVLKLLKTFKDLEKAWEERADQDLPPISLWTRKTIGIPVTGFFCGYMAPRAKARAIKGHSALAIAGSRWEFLCRRSMATGLWISRSFHVVLMRLLLGIPWARALCDCSRPQLLEDAGGSSISKSFKISVEVLLLPFGVLSDSVPIMGMHRKPYLMRLGSSPVLASPRIAWLLVGLSACMVVMRPLPDPYYCIGHQLKKTSQAALSRC